MRAIISHPCPAPWEVSLGNAATLTAGLARLYSREEAVKCVVAGICEPELGRFVGLSEATPHVPRISRDKQFRVRVGPLTKAFSDRPAVGGSASLGNLYRRAAATPVRVLLSRFTLLERQAWKAAEPECPTTMVLAVPGAWL